MIYHRGIELSELLGKTLVEVTRGTNSNDDCLLFVDSEGNRYRLYHCQGCCEEVRIEDIVGDLNDLVGAPILLAECVTSQEHPADFADDSYLESFLWTFYKFATIKGYVDIRWFGTSNGYYSESVDFVKEMSE